MKLVVLSTLITLALIGVSSASNVLMLLPLGSKSHKNIFTSLARNLVAKGHEVTVVSMYGETSDRTPPFNDVVASQLAETTKRITGDFNVFQMMQENRGRNVNSDIMKVVVKNLPEYCDAFLRDPALRQVWNSKPDLILLPAFMNECGLIAVRKWGVPFIYVTTSGLTPWTADLVGTPEHPAVVPNQYLPYSDAMTLPQRVINSILRLAAPALRRHYVLGRLDAVAQRFLRDPNVALAEVERNVSLVLVNSHHSLGFPRALTPNVIEVGGMHCRPPMPIQDPKLQSFLDATPDNSAILFSLGSHIRSSQMPVATRQMFVNAFARLPYRVVWKWEGAPIANLSSNVLLRPWLPQQDLLGHRAVGGFFSHGGLLSTQEAVYHGVPLVGLPLMSDQHLNVKQAETTGVALGLDLATLTEDKIVAALTRIMEDPNFRQKAQQRSVVMRDQETLPLDRATYYTEYVLRHGGAAHLRSASASLSTKSFLLLDVIAVLVGIAAIFSVIVFFTVRFAIKNVVRFAAFSQKKLVNHLRTGLRHLKSH